MQIIQMYWVKCIFISIIFISIIEYKQKYLTLKLKKKDYKKLKLYK